MSRFSLETSYEKVAKGPRSAGGPGSGNPEPDGLFAIRNRTYSNLDDFSCLIHIYIWMIFSSDSDVISLYIICDNSALCLPFGGDHPKKNCHILP